MTGKKRQILGASLLIAITLVWIWGNSLLPAEASRAISGSVQDFVGQILGLPPDPGGTGEGLLRKIAHLSEFAVLGAEIAMLICLVARKASPNGDDVTNKRFRTFPKSDPMRQSLREPARDIPNCNIPSWVVLGLWLLCGLGAAVIDESIQIWSPGRAAMIQDVWIDMAGFVIGGLLIVSVKGLVNTLRKVRKIRK